MNMVIAVAPLFALWGQIAAVVILIFVFISVLVTLVFNLVVTFALAWVREKSDVIKLLRPLIEDLNKTTEAATQGVAPAEDKNAIVRAVANIPHGVQVADQKVDEAASRVANVVIEFRARTLQAKTVVKAFLLPGLRKPGLYPAIKDHRMEFNSPGYRALLDKHNSEIAAEPVEGDGYNHSITARQLREDVPAR